MSEQKIGVVIEARNRAGRAFKDIENNLDTVKKKTEAWNKKFEQTFDALKKGGAALTGLGAGLGFMAKGWIDVAGTAEETQSKFNTVFDGMSEEMNGWATDFAGQVGRSENEIKGFTAGLSDILKPLGFATDGAADMSKEMVQLALDVASFNDKQDGDVIRSFTSALTGERESLKSLGIVISEADVKQEAYRSGLAKQGEELSKTAKAQATMNLLFANTKDAQGDLARTSDSYANSQKAMNAAFKDMKVSLGQELLPIVTPFVQKITDMIRGFRELSPELRKVISTSTLVAAGIGLIGGPILLLIGFLPQIVAGVGLVSGAFAALLGPIGLIIAAVAGLTIAWQKDLGGIRTFVTETFNGLSAEFTALKWASEDVFNFIKDVIVNSFTVASVFIETISKTFVATMQLMTGDFRGAFETMQTDSTGIFTAIGDFFAQKLFDFVQRIKLFKTEFSQAWNLMLTDVKNFFESTWNGIVTYFEGVLKKIVDIVNKIKAAANSVKNKIQAPGKKLGGAIYDMVNPKERAFGGMTPGNEPVLVGERGPELVQFPQAGRVVPNNQISGGGSANITVNLNLSNNNFSDENQFKKYIEHAKRVMVEEIEISLAGSFSG